MTRSNHVFLTGLAVLLAAGTASAEPLDTTKALTCTLNGSSQCDAVAACIPVTLEQIDLTDTLLVDFANNQLTSKANERTSPIDDVDVLETVLVVQGHQNGRGWTMVIDRETGHLSAALAEIAGSFVLAGDCAAN
jgi:hypothetical protein